MIGLYRENMVGFRKESVGILIFTKNMHNEAVARMRTWQVDIFRILMT